MKSIKEILAERGNTHGDFTDNSEIGQRLKEIVRSGKSWEQRSNIEKEAIEYVLSKIARWVSAPGFHLDNPLDCAGYMTLVANREDIINETTHTQYNQGKTDYTLEVRGTSE